MQTDDGQRFIEQNTDFARGLSTAERRAVDHYAEHHAGGLIVLLRHLDQEGWYVKAHDTWGDDGPCIVHIYCAEDPDHDGEQVLSFPDGSSALESFLTVEAPAEARVTGKRGEKPTMTAGEIISALWDIDPLTPVTVPTEGWYLNVKEISRPDPDNGIFTVLIETADDFDTRQF